MIITSISKIKAQTTGFNLFCKEEGIDPENHKEPEEGCCVDKMDLYRYGAYKAAQELQSSVDSFKESLFT